MRNQAKSISNHILVHMDISQFFIDAMQVADGGLGGFEFRVLSLPSFSQATFPEQCHAT
jgi:hypothetical protein